MTYVDFGSSKSSGSVSEGDSSSIDESSLVASSDASNASDFSYGSSLSSSSSSSSDSSSESEPPETMTTCSQFADVLSIEVSPDGQEEHFEPPFNGPIAIHRSGAFLLDWKTRDLSNDRTDFIPYTGSDELDYEYRWLMACLLGTATPHVYLIMEVHYDGVNNALKSMRYEWYPGADGEMPVGSITLYRVSGDWSGPAQVTLTW